MHGRVHIPKVPLVRWNLPVRLHVPLACKYVELLLGECGVNEGQRNAVERRVPCSEEWVFPSMSRRISEQAWWSRKENTYLSGMERISAM